MKSGVTLSASAPSLFIAEVMVPSDREIPRTVNEGVPIVQALPQSDAAQAFRGLATSYVARQEPAAAAEEVGAGKGKKRFGRRG